jgi:hypothetical protein
MPPPPPGIEGAPESFFGRSATIASVVIRSAATLAQKASRSETLTLKFNLWAGVSKEVQTVVCARFLH